MLIKIVFLCSLFNLINGDEICGISEISPVTNQPHFPWIAIIKSSINKAIDGSDKFVCGSSIISKKYAITGAHCIHAKNTYYKRKANHIYLISNIYDLNNLQNTHKILIEEIKIHSDWDFLKDTFDADLALLKFKEEVNIMPICLFYNSEIDYSFGEIISFTDPEEDEPGYYTNHNLPRSFKMPIRSECSETQKRFKTIESNRTYCAGGLNSGPCLEIGNSGSSMAINIEDKFYLRGIVSASFIDFDGCDNYTYSLFTDVLKFKDWITLNILE